MSENEDHSYPNLKSLVFGRCSLPAEKLRILSSTFPDIISLELRGSFLDIPNTFIQNSFKNLIKLNLAYCKLKNFQELEVLSLYENLAELKLCNNPIEKVVELGGFPKLRKINLEGTNIIDLPSIYALNSYPVLTEIRVGNTPLCNRLRDHVRKVLVAYLFKATKINGGYVDKKERTLHERQFIRDFSDPNNGNSHVKSAEYLDKLVGFHLELEEVEINEKIFQSALKTHGHVYKFADISLDPPTTANLNFETEDGRKEIREVPLTWKVSNLKKLCESLFQIPEKKQKLYYLDCEVPIFGMELLRFDNKVLRTLKIKDNDVITVREKD